MYQAKGTAPIFNVDRAPLKSTSYVVEVALNLGKEIKIPTPPLTFTTYLSLGSSIQELLSKSLMIDVSLLYSILSDIKVWRSVSSKGAGFAFKGTNVLFRADRRWLAAVSPFVLLAEVPLGLISELQLGQSGPITAEALLAMKSSGFALIESAITEELISLLNAALSEFHYNTVALKLSPKARESLIEYLLLTLSASVDPNILISYSNERKLSLLASAVLPVIPGIAIYSLPLTLHSYAREEINSINMLNLLFSIHSHYMLPRVFENHIKFSVEGSSAQELSTSLFLKHKLISALVSLSAVNASLLFMSLFLSPAFRLLVAEAILPFEFGVVSIHHSSFNTLLLIKSLIMTELETPNIFEVLVNFLASPSWQTQSTFTFNMMLVSSFASLSSIRALSSLTLGILMRSASINEIIGTVLIELHPRPQFSFSSNFITELLLHLTSSLPLPQAVLPQGALFFTDIVRIYKYLIDLQQ